jgi:hypothetical protein
MFAARLLLALVMLDGAHAAHAHGIAGDRFFPGTLTFDDPAVADEAIVPNFSSSKHPGEGGDVVDNRFDWAFFRLLTPNLGVGIESPWVHRNWGTALRSGFSRSSYTHRPSTEQPRDKRNPCRTSSGEAPRCAIASAIPARYRGQ